MALSHPSTIHRAPCQPTSSVLASGQELWYNWVHKKGAWVTDRLPTHEEVSSETRLAQVTGQIPPDCFLGSQSDRRPEYGLLHHPHASTTLSHSHTNRPLTDANNEPNAYSITHGQPSAPYAYFYSQP